MLLKESRVDAARREQIEIDIPLALQTPRRRSKSEATPPVTSPVTSSPQLVVPP